MLPDSYEYLTTTLLYRKLEIRFKEVSNAMINNIYRKINKKVYQDSIAVTLVVRDKSENKNQGRYGRSPSKSKNKYNEKDEYSDYQ